MNTLFQCPGCGGRHERVAADGIVPNPEGDLTLCDACQRAMETLWPCVTCGAVDFEDAGEKCRALDACSADDERQQREMDGSAATRWARAPGAEMVN